MKKLQLCLLCIASLVVAGCASDQKSGLVGAASSPLNDLNMVREEIPPVLQEALQEPYAVPDETRCESLHLKITALDQVLAPDIDADSGADENKSGLGKKAVSSAGKAAVGALRSTAEDIMPFRGWVRKLTGAERHSQKVSAAIGAGILRRAYLKGIRSAKGCN